MNSKKYNIGIIGNHTTHPSTKAFLLKFMRITTAIADEVYVISGDKPLDISKVHWLKTEYKIKRTILERIINGLLVQLSLSIKAIKISKKVDVIFVFSPSMVLPIIALKLMNKKIMVFGAQKIDSVVVRLFGRLSFIICDLIVVESEAVIKHLNITRYKKKIVKGNIYVNTNFFKKWRKIRERDNVVGYIGILNERKGTGNLLEAITKLSKKALNIKFLIGGIGPFENIMKNISKNNTNVKFNGFVPQDNLPKYFNDMKLFVLPSLSEGVPNIILEAMACGTPVLAAPVGGIPDVIKDGETGFILENNSPECIARNVIRVLNYPDLDKIVKNAKKLIEKEYTYKSAVERYRKILENV